LFVKLANEGCVMDESSIPSILRMLFSLIEALTNFLQPSTLSSLEEISTVSNDAAVSVKAIAGVDV
jgi:hypothetical protein